MHRVLAIYFVAYGLLAIFHILIQICLAHAEHRKQNQPSFKSKHEGECTESVAVVVPVYNEFPDTLDESIASIKAQDYHALHIMVVDDGSTNYDELYDTVYSHYRHDLLEVIRLPKNVGKRHAQKIGFDKATADIIVTIDSDTVLRSRFAISEIVKRFKDPKIGAVTGHVAVANKTTNILTRLISTRYWMAFSQERAAQSFFNVLMCCSGPFSAYRKPVLDKVKDAYVSQRFLGQPCTYGDDRHLTNLVLVEGHRVVYDKRAIAFTYVPENLQGYVKQQVRWNKSFYREMLWTLKSTHKHHPYLIYDLLMQLTLPFMLLFALAYTVAESVQGHPGFLYFYFLTIIAIGLLRSMYGLYRTNDKNFLLFVIYGLIHIFVLLPTRLYALTTLRRTGWGTR